LIGGGRSWQTSFYFTFVKYYFHIFNTGLWFLQQAIEQSKKEHETNVVEKHRLIRMEQDKVRPCGTFNARGTWLIVYYSYCYYHYHYYYYSPFFGACF
jgi:hypothetical protein